ncbi:hypothetical protein [Nocardioides hankookensis]|uniref:PASTA domain-containing protein n=1 Tax=Nocardioides hankookensis TaxID=443157 RepID=A0ABW1LQ49_9ACTN
MRRTLGLLLLLLALVGCGEKVHTDGGLKAEPADEVTQVALLTGTSAGGEVATEPTPLPDAEAVEKYAAQFRNDELQGDIVTTAEQTEVPDGQQLAAAVVAVGCEVPEEVVGTGSGDDLALHAPVPSPTKECFAPMTTVALVLVPA